MKIKSYLLLTLLLSIKPIFLIAQSYEWGGRFGGGGEDVVKRMYVDAEGNSYTTGYFTDTADFDIGNTEYNLTSNGLYDVFVQKTNTVGNLEWAVNIGGNMFDYGTGITADAQGNVYVTGYFDETVDFDPGAGEWLLTSQGGGDVFILKLNSNGEFVWAKSIGGIDYEESTAIGVDSTGNVYLLGYLYATVDFDPGLGEVLMSSSGLSDTFLLRLNNTGDFDYVYTYGGDGIDLALDMVVKNENEIFLSGYFNGTTDLDPRPNETHMVTSTEDFAGYAMQINESGEIVNLALTEGGSVSILGIAQDAENNMAITGNFSGTVNFDPNSGNSDYTFSSTNAYNGFVLKVKPDGTIAWAAQLASNNPVFGYDLAIAPNGNVISTGFFEGEADFDPNPNTNFTLTSQSVNPTDAYVWSLDADGNFLSAYQFGGVGFIDTHQLGVDASNNIYLSAQFGNSVDINPLPNEVDEVTVVDFRDNYLLKFKDGLLNIPTNHTQELSLFPNPTTDVIQLSMDKDFSAKDYVIYNLMGQEVHHGLLDETKTLRVNSLSRGMYILSLNGGAANLKFIKD
jgi:hypothetical protein